MNRNMISYCIYRFYMLWQAEKRLCLVGFTNLKIFQILDKNRNQHLNKRSKKNQHFIKPIIHNEIPKFQNCEIVCLWLHFWSTCSLKHPSIVDYGRLAWQNILGRCKKIATKVTKSKCTLIPKCWTYDYGIRFSIDAQFCFLILDKNQNFAFSVDEGIYLLCIASHKISWILLKLWNYIGFFEVIEKKIHINYKMYNKLWIFYCMWKS